MEKYKTYWLNAVFAACLGLLALGLTGCATDGQIEVGEELEVGRATFSEDLDVGYKTFPEYRISPGDLLDVLYQVKSWELHENFTIAVDHVLTVRFVGQPELNETQRVRPDGNISLAYIGSIPVVGKTVEELTKELKELYGQYLTETELYVVVEEFRSAIKELKRDLMTAPRGLSRLVTVRPDGKATFAMVGDVAVAGRTVPDVTEELNHKYKSVLPGLSVDLFLEKHTGSKIYVFGEVFEPGAYQVQRPTSVFEAFAMAGSVTPGARLDSVIVFRQKKDRVIATRIDLKKIMFPVKLKEINHNDEEQSDAVQQAYEVLSGSKSEASVPHQLAAADMFYLHPDDIVYVPRRRLSTAAQITQEVADLLFFRGWGVNFGGGYDFGD